MCAHLAPVGAESFYANIKDGTGERSSIHCRPLNLFTECSCEAIDEFGIRRGKGPLGGAHFSK